MTLINGIKRNYRKTIHYLSENGDRIIYHDQDALNAVLYEDWEQLHPKWNMQTSLILNVIQHQMKNERQYKEGNEKPSIVHFTGHDKPWNTLKDHPYTNLYLKISTQYSNESRRDQ